MGSDWLEYGKGPRHEPDINTGAPPRAPGSTGKPWPVLKSAQEVEAERASQTSGD